MVLLNFASRLDHRLSEPVFNLRLSFLQEIFLGIPATWCGMPLTAVLLLPLLLSVIECRTIVPEECEAGAVFGTNLITTAALALLAVWVPVCYESANAKQDDNNNNNGVMKKWYGIYRVLFFLGTSKGGMALMLLTPVYTAIGLFETLLRVSPAQRVIYQYLLSWIAVQSVILVVKTLAQRRRPAHRDARLRATPRHLGQVRVDKFVCTKARHQNTSVHKVWTTDMCWHIGTLCQNNGHSVVGLAPTCF